MFSANQTAEIVACILLAKKLGPNLSEMEVRTFVSLKTVIEDRLLAFRALIFKKKALFNLCVLSAEPCAMNKLAAYCTVSLCFVSFSFVPVEVIFSSKSPTKRSKKMFPFNFQRSGNNSGFLGPKCCLMFCCYGRLSLDPA